MKKNYSKLLFVMVLSLVFSALSSVGQVIITQWNFDAENLNPSIGSGEASNVGVTTTAWAGGNPGRGWNTTPYPEQSTGSGTSGIQVNVSTQGYTSINVSWDNRLSNTAANRLRLQYTLNGTDWNNFEASSENALNNDLNGQSVGFDDGRYVADTGTVWFVRSASFADIPAANDNPAFAVRLVTEFVDGASYGAATPTSSYGTNGTIRFDNVTVSGSAGNSPMLFANPSVVSGLTYVVGQGPSEPATIAVSGSNLTPETDDITIAAPESFEISLDGINYTGSYTMSYSGASLPETIVYVRLKSGLASGMYSETLNISGGGANDVNIQLSGSVTSGLEPALTNVLLPRFIEGAVPNNNRVPFAYRATIINLTPNATYRYYNRVVISTEAPDATGAGNIILVSPSQGTFTRLSSPNLGTDGAYGVFTTDAAGSFTGWFMTEPTGNATRFKPGNEIFMRIILNDGNNGTQPVTYLTTEESAKVIAFSTSTADTSGTAVRGISDFAAKNFVFLYDNSEGTGRPLYATQIESTGIDFAGATTYAPFYSTDVAGVEGKWGGIVPNNNASGVMRIEERSLTDGSVVDFETSANGIWGTVDTKNPTGGLENVLVINTILGLPELTGNIGKVYSFDKMIHVELNNPGNSTIEVYNMSGSLLNIYNIAGTEETFETSLPAGIYVLKVSTPQGMFSKKILIK